MKQLFIILAFITTVAVATDVKAETNTVSSTVVTNSTPPTANAPTIMIGEKVADMILKGA